MTGANVVKFPERPIRPETAACIAIVADCNHDAAELFNLARITLNSLHRMRPQGVPEQGLVNGLTIALLAFAEIGGVTKLIEDELA
jgi:hypothetical protein